MYFIYALSFALLMNETTADLNLKVIEVDRETGQIALEFENKTNSRVRIWDDRYSEGYYSICVLTRESGVGGIKACNRVSAGFTVNPPRYIEIAPNEKKRVEFCLLDNSWNLSRSERKLNFDHLKFMINPADSAALREYGIWDHFVESNWFKINKETKVLRTNNSK